MIKPTDAPYKVEKEDGVFHVKFEGSTIMAYTSEQMADQVVAALKGAYYMGYQRGFSEATSIAAEFDSFMDPFQ